MKSITAAFILLFTISKNYSQEFIGSKIDLEQIKQNTINFSQYVMDSNYEMIGTSYTKDAMIFPNNTLIIEGTEAIVNYWKIQDDVQITHQKISQKEIKIVVVYMCQQQWRYMDCLMLIYELKFRILFGFKSQIPLLQ